jgi:hypothetical protein
LILASPTASGIGAIHPRDCRLDPPIAEALDRVARWMDRGSALVEQDSRRAVFTPAGAELFA